MAGSKLMTYFLHAKCGDSVYLDVSSLFKIVTSFGITRNSLKIRTGSIIQVDETGKTVFYCSNCKETIEDLNAILGVCMYCGKSFPIKTMVSPSTSNGIYCKEHGTTERFPGETMRELKTIVAKMTVK